MKQHLSWKSLAFSEMFAATLAAAIAASFMSARFISPGNEIKSSSSWITGERVRLLSSKKALIGLGGLEVVGDGGAETPAFKKALVAAFFFAFSSLSASSFLRLSSLASLVKLGLFDRVEEVG